MSGRRYALFAALALFIVFVSVNLIGNIWFRSWRLDLTEAQLYSLSPGTRSTLDELTEPMELKFYYSRDAGAAFPYVSTYAARVREMLQTFQARSNGRVRFVEVNVEPFSEEEDEAEADDIEPRQVIEGADPIYMGLSGSNAIDDSVAIPFLDPSRESFLEYEITRLIYELENSNPTRVALITALPFDPAGAQMPNFGGSQPSLIELEMGRLMQVVKLAPDFTEVPADVDVLAIIHPWALTEQQLYAVDQHVLRHGRAFVAIDPASIVAQTEGGADPFSMGAMAPVSSSLELLLTRWGVTMAPDVVLDLDGALPIRVPDPMTGQAVEMPQPLLIGVPRDRRDNSDMMTAWLQREVNFGLVGGLAWTEREGVTMTPLMQTTGRTMRIQAERALMQPSPMELIQTWPQGGGRIETIALHLSGNVETAFPNGAPAGAAPPAQGQQALTRSATPAEIVVVADVDFMNDRFYLNSRGVPQADNGAFVLNVIDTLSGSDALVSLRARAPSERRMEMLERMARDADRRIQRREEELRAELADTEQRLAELQATGRGSGMFSGDLGAELTPEERTEIERFRERVIAVRSELRSVNRDLRADIDRVEALIVFINLWLAPMLVAGAGLFLFWRRQRRARRRA